jgi:hypothetical protein
VLCAIVVGGVGAAAVSASITGVEQPVPVVSPAPLPLTETVPGLTAPSPRPEQALSAFTPEIPDPAPDVRTVAMPTPLPSSSGAAGSPGVPESIAAAYRNAEAVLASEKPSCHLPWYLLAGIGQVESGHAYNGQIDADGTTVTRILGPVRGGDPQHDRAVGPMQFIPATWARYASDGNDDGESDPNNIYDATLAAGRYLCAGGLDMSDPADETAALLRYDNSPVYVADVLAWSQAYELGGDSVTGVPSVPVSAAPVEEPSNPPASTLVPVPDTPPPPPPLPFSLPPLPPLPCLILCPPPPR